MSDVEMQSMRHQQLRMQQNCSFELADQDNDYMIYKGANTLNYRPSTGLGKIIHKIDAATNELSHFTKEQTLSSIRNEEDFQPDGTYFHGLNFTQNIPHQSSTINV